MKSIWPPTPQYIRRPMESATTCPVRSTSIAELIAVMCRNERMTWVSLVKSTARISTIGLSSTKSYRRCVPTTNAATILPRLRALRLAGDDALLDQVDHRVGEHLRVDPEVALGRPGTRPSPPGSPRSPAGGSPRRGRGPRCSAPIRRSTSPMAGRGDLRQGRRPPRRRGRCRRRGRRSRRGCAASARLSWTITGARPRIAACIASTDVPSEQKPWASGGRGADEDGVERQRAGQEQRRDVGQEDGHEVGPALVHRPPRVARR